MRRVFVRAALLAALSAVVALPTFAQTAQVGVISGQVTDDSGGALPGATVTLTSQERGFSRIATTDAQGRYRFAAVPIGNYTIRAILSGFQEVTLTDNLVETEKTTDVAVAMKVAGVAEQVTVLGETPIVDTTHTTVSTRARKEEFDKLPVGRNYQSLMAFTPGVVGTGNVNAHGALSSNNQFLFDGVNTTDPTTGTFGTNLTFESIQEVVVYTSAVSAEYGRATGAIVNVITKSGTNRYEGSFKYITTNDNWNAQNKTKSETTGASLARTKFNQVNPLYEFTGGGPIRKDHDWFFINYAWSKNTSPQRQTIGPVPEDFQQTTTSPFLNVRATEQITPNHQVWVKYHRVPTNGFVIDYTGAAAERFALTRQDQGGSSFAAQWSGVFSNNWTAEVIAAENDEFIFVFPFEVSPLNRGVPRLSQADGKWYNGGAFDGFVLRPRNQLQAATTYFADLAGRSHSIKAGFDWQNMESGAEFKFPGAQLFVDASFDQVSRQFVPLFRRDYDTGASISTGNSYAIYARDKFEATKRLFVEAGVRFEKQTGDSDVGAATVNTTTFSPRLSASYDLLGSGKSLVQATYGRFFQSILQGFSDSFANVPQRTNYNNFVWNGREYVFQNRIELGASTFRPNTDLDPTFTDEVTFGFQHQIGRYFGSGIRYVYRQWGNLIDDVITFRPDRTPDRRVVNYDKAERNYHGVELSFEKRFSQNWNAAGSYTYSRVRGNHFVDNFSPLGDYLDSQCRTTLDPGLGNNGVVSCAEANEGANRFGRPGFDRPHNIKLAGAYSRPLGRTRLTAGAIANAISKTTYAKNRSVNVLFPGTTTNAGPTTSYLYEPTGSERIPGMDFLMDASIEVTFRPIADAEAGVRGEIFNLWDSQEKIGVANTAWCNSTAVAACQTARDVYGKATARGNFQGPRTYRVTLLFRF